MLNKGAGNIQRKDLEDKPVTNVKVCQRLSGLLIVSDCIRFSRKSSVLAENTLFSTGAIRDHIVLHCNFNP